MSDFINKVITVIMVFAMLVLAPLLISYKSDNMLARREILNDVEVFIDKVQDTSSITVDDLNNLYMTCNSHGLTVDVDVKRLIATAVYDNDNEIAQTNYFAVDDTESLAISLLTSTSTVNPWLLQVMYRLFKSSTVIELVS